MKEFKFCWGEPYCIRNALKYYYKCSQISFNLDSITYQAYEGNPELLVNTKEFIKKTTNLDYRFIIITQGATGAINIVLRSLYNKYGFNRCLTNKYYFPYYPKIIEKNKYIHDIKLDHDYENYLKISNVLGLVDSPSNPTGSMTSFLDTNNNIIWDSVYHNPVFVNSSPKNPEHRVNCGSYSKAFGLTGARIGWIATNDENDYNLFKDENTYENCSLPYFSQAFISDVMKNTDIDSFMQHSKHLVNNNREMFHKISYLFDGQLVPEDGMYYSAWTTPHTIQLLDKLNVKSIKMDISGKDEFLRFNLAQMNEVTKEAINLILKEDSIL